MDNIQLINLQIISIYCQHNSDNTNHKYSDISHFSRFINL